MEQKNKKNFRAGLIITVSILAFILAVMLVYKNKRVIPQVVKQKIEKLQEKEETKETEKENEVNPKDIKDITGKIISMDISAIKVKTDKEELTFVIPEKGVSFMEQKKQKNGDLSMKEIGLFQVPKNKNVEIQYNDLTKEVMLIVVK